MYVEFFIDTERTAFGLQWYDSGMCHMFPHLYVILRMEFLNIFVSILVWLKTSNFANCIILIPALKCTCWLMYYCYMNIAYICLCVYFYRVVLACCFPHGYFHRSNPLFSLYQCHLLEFFILCLWCVEQLCCSVDHVRWWSCFGCLCIVAAKCSDVQEEHLTSTWWKPWKDNHLINGGCESRKM